MFVAASSGVADEEQGAASALTTTLQQVGGSPSFRVTAPRR
ncbi:hypothetical protein AB0I91_33955 [Actinosynnema sp. NPDC049800]